MILFNEKIVDVLNEYFSKNDQFVDSILLASYGFNIRFQDIEIQCNERVFATIDGQTYEWDDSPNSGPWDSLGRQLAKKATLQSSSLLTISFESGDSIGIETKEGHFESVVMTFPPQGESAVMEVF